MKKLMMAAALAALACGCVTVNKNDGGDACLKPKICKDCVHEKYTVAQQPVTAKSTAIGICGLFVIGDPEVTHFSDQTCDRFLFGSAGAAKNGAYSKACDAAKCDSIVGARYTLTRMLLQAGLRQEVILVADLKKAVSARGRLFWYNTRHL